jgi:hypothetical protein
MHNRRCITRSGEAGAGDADQDARTPEAVPARCEGGPLTLLAA